MGLASNFFQVCDHSAMNTLNVGASPISLHAFLYIDHVTFLVQSVHHHSDCNGESVRSLFETGKNYRFQTWLEGREYTIGSDDAIICGCMKCQVCAFLRLY